MEEELGSRNVGQAAWADAMWCAGSFEREHERVSVECVMSVRSEIERFSVYIFCVTLQLSHQQAAPFSG